MDTTNNIDEVKTTDNEQPKPSASNSAIRNRRILVTIGAILVLAGWLIMMKNEWVSLGCTVVGLVLSAIGVRIPPGPRRNIAITAIVAASVLLVVFALFASLFVII